MLFPVSHPPHSPGLIEEAHSIQDIEERLKKCFILGGHKAYAIVKVAKSTDLILLSSLSKDMTRKLFMESGFSRFTGHRDLGIFSHNLKRWNVQYRKRREQVFPDHSKENLTPHEEKVRRLQK